MNNHKEEFYRGNDVSCRVGAKKGNLVSFKVLVDKVKETPKGCFGCKKFWCREALADNHLRECKNKESHKQFCQTLLPDVTKDVEDSSEVVLLLKQEVERLKKKIARLEGRVEEADASDRAITVVQEVITTLSFEQRRQMFNKCQEIDKRTKDAITEGRYELTEWDDWFGDVDTDSESDSSSESDTEPEKEKEEKVWQYYH